MKEVKVTLSGVYDIVQSVQLTDEQWENAVDPETGKLYDLDTISEETFDQAKAGGLCDQCSGWGREFSRSLGEETDIVHISDVNGKTLYDRDAVK